MGLRIFQQQKKIFLESLTPACHGNTFIGTSSKIHKSCQNHSLGFLGHMTIPKRFNNLKEDPLSYILQKTALEYLNSKQNDSSRSEKLMKW